MFNDQVEPIYRRSVRIHKVAWKTFQKQWTIEIGGERGSWRSMLSVLQDDDDDDEKLDFKKVGVRTGSGSYEWKSEIPSKESWI